MERGAFFRAWYATMSASNAFERVHSMRLLIIRHGESQADLLDVHEGRADFPLTDRGHRQAAAMADWVCARYSIDALYTSTLLRARETAAHLADEIGIDAIQEPLLMEFDNGLLAGMPREEAAKKYPMVHDLPPDTSVYGQETRLVFRHRADTVLSNIIAHHEDASTIALVSHGGMINQLYHAFLGLPVASNTVFHTGDAAVHEWRIDGAVRRVVYANASAPVIAD